MKRISSQLPATDTSFYLRQREVEMNDMSNKIGAQSNFKDLRDDPLGAARSVRLQSEIFRADRYGKNIQDVRARLAVAEGNVQSAMDILQRIRELAVQGANGTLDAQQMGYIGDEVDQLLGELLAIGNSKDQAGNYLFAGTQSKTEPFRLTEGRIPGGGGDRVVSVDYLGNADPGIGEISEGSTVQTHLVGTRVFWAEQQQIYSTVDAGQYRVQRDSSIRIDGTEIRLATGDTVTAVAAKINDANVAVRARIDPVANGLVLETTVPHQIAAEDLAGGTVLQDLGILAPGGTHPPLNVSPTARVFGGSVFDQVIALRDALYEGSSDKVGTAALRGMENAVTALAGTLGDIGARDARLDAVGKRLAYLTPDLVGFESQIHDLDMADAITKLKTLEATNEAALSATARALNRPKLLDFLR